MHPEESIMHPNLLAYDDHEVFGSEEDISVYREAKLKGVKKNISLIRKNFNKNLRVLEIGSGNSKFLYALELENMLVEGYGFEISNSRNKFADRWKRDLGIENIHNIEENILETNFDRLPSFDLAYCVDLAFQFLDPVEADSDLRILKSIYSRLREGGKVILELDCHGRLIDKMEDGKVKTWQEFKEPDPWQYLLWDCNLENDYLTLNKTFLKRDLSEISKSRVVLKNYRRSDIIHLLFLAGFENVQVFESWDTDGDLLKDEFIVIGEKND
jgi:SAM-dependent methyltransferase